MNKSLPLISIGICCFNAEDTINRALNSALKQNWNNFEIILIDDCSIDNSKLIIQEKVDQIKTISIKFQINKKNYGPGYTRQKIIDLASGDFLVFFDDDDESHPNRIRDQYNKIISIEKEYGNTLIACYASGERRYKSGYIKPLPAIGSFNSPICGKYIANYLLFYDMSPEFFYGSGVPACSLMARISTFNNVGGFDKELRRVEDVDFAIRLSLNGGYFVGLKNNLFTQYSTNSIDKSPQINLESEQKVVLKYKNYLDNINLFYYAYKWPKLRYFHFSKKYLSLVYVLFGLITRYPLRTISHFSRTGSRRLIHEFLIRNSKGL